MTEREEIIERLRDIRKDEIDLSRICKAVMDKHDVFWKIEEFLNLRDKLIDLLSIDKEATTAPTAERITDELRKWLEQYTMRKDTYDEMITIIDRIDAAHDEALSQVYMDMSDSEWIRLPKDADGVPICLGDKMDGVNKYDKNQEVTGTVTTISFDATLDPYDSTSVGIRVWADDHKSYRVIYIDPQASVYRHHHDPTVEDTLHELIGKAIMLSEVDGENDLVAEYAAKLRLAGDAE